MLKVDRVTVNNGLLLLVIIDKFRKADKKVCPPPLGVTMRRDHTSHGCECVKKEKEMK